MTMRRRRDLEVTDLQVEALSEHGLACLFVQTTAVMDFSFQMPLATLQRLGSEIDEALRRCQPPAAPE